MTPPDDPNTGDDTWEASIANAKKNIDEVLRGSEDLRNQVQDVINRLGRELRQREPDDDHGGPAG